LEAFSGLDWDKDGMVFDDQEFLGLEAFVTTEMKEYTRADNTAGKTSNVVKYYPLPQSEMEETI
jgi:hypothetical protein